MMQINGWGVATRKDYLLVDFEKEPLITKFRDIQGLEPERAVEKYNIKQSPHWSFREAHRQMTPDVGNSIRPILFRPFDIRYVYYEKFMIERGDHRHGLMSHMFDDNRALITVRRSETSEAPAHFYSTNQLSVLHSTSAKEGNFVFPLYLYSDASNLFDTGVRRPNLSPEFVAELAEKVGLEFINDGKGDLEGTFGPEDVFHYIYATFHAPSYRERYAEFLKIDFPRVPFVGNRLFRNLTAHGETLVALHLMERVGSPISSYPVDGDNIVDKVSFTENEGGKTGRVYINKTQYFDGVPTKVWNFYVGGYQVLQKWLKDRKGRTLSYDDLRHYGFIVSALLETIGVMSEIDTAIEGAGGWPLE